MKAITSLLAISVSLASTTLQAEIAVPQVSPYTSDANTVLLQHFDGSSTGSENGAVTYTSGVFGQGVHLVDTAYISYNLGALPQGTVEFWANFDNLSNSTGNPPALIGSYYSQFFAGTMYILIAPVTDTGSGPMGQPNGGVHTGGAWNHSPANSAVITPNTWHNYALTWGNAGLRLYLDGSLVSSTANTGGQNPSTGWWAIGVSLKKS